MHLVRHQAKNQSYVGFKPGRELASGRLSYAGGGEQAGGEEYAGSHQAFTRSGFGEFSSQAWSYRGFWKNDQMEGLGKFTNHATKESFLGVMAGGQIHGWGEYKRLRKNKTLKGPRSVHAGREKTVIWSEFHEEAAPADRHRVVQSEDGMQRFLAFPRIEEVTFHSKNASRYLLQVVGEGGRNGALSLIRRLGPNTYKLTEVHSNREPVILSRDEALPLAHQDLFETHARRLLEDALDPPLQIQGLNYSVVKVLKAGGLGCRYLVSSELEDGNADVRGSLMTQYGSKMLYVAKGYTVASLEEVRRCRHELHMLRLAADAGLAPALGICHGDEADEVVLGGHSYDALHLSEGADHFPKKYFLLTEYLRRGEFLDAVLGFRAPRRQRVLSAFDRLVLVKKLFKLYADLEKLQLYHGQAFPSHIYVDNFYSEEGLEACDLKLLDFSEAVYLGADHHASRFEAAANLQPAGGADPAQRFYVHGHYSCPKAMRVFRSPLLRYLASEHLSLPLSRLFFDVRLTDVFSVVVIALLVVAPTIPSENALKRVLQDYADERYQNYRTGLKRAKTGTLVDGSTLDFAERIIVTDYSSHAPVHNNVSSLVRALKSALKDCTPELQARRPPDAPTFARLHETLKLDLAPLISFFRDTEFQPKPGRQGELEGGPTALEDTEERDRSFHEGIASRLLLGGGGLFDQRPLTEDEAAPKASLIERFFGREWYGPEEDAAEELKEDATPGGGMTHAKPRRAGELSPMQRRPLPLSSQNEEPTRQERRAKRALHASPQERAGAPDEVRAMESSDVLGVTSDRMARPTIINKTRYGGAKKEHEPDQDSDRRPGGLRKMPDFSLRVDSPDLEKVESRPKRRPSKKKGYHGLLGPADNNENKGRLGSPLGSQRDLSAQELMMVWQLHKMTPRQNMEALRTPRKKLKVDDSFVAGGGNELTDEDDDL